MAQEKATTSRRVSPRTATTEHVGHLRTHHTTPSRSRGGEVMEPLGPRWRNPAMGRASMAALIA